MNIQLDIIGKGLNEAASIINAADLSFRVISRDGVKGVVTRDYREGRINLTLVAGKVTAYTFG